MGIKVLIVEDEFIVANDLRLIVEKAGYKVSGIAASAGLKLMSLCKTQTGYGHPGYQVKRKTNRN